MLCRLLLIFLMDQAAKASLLASDNSGAAPPACPASGDSGACPERPTAAALDPRQPRDEEGEDRGREDADEEEEDEWSEEWMALERAFGERIGAVDPHAEDEDEVTEESETEDGR